MKLIFFLSLICSSIFAQSAVTVYFNYGIFNTPNAKPYVETYLTITGNSVKFSPTNNGYKASVNVTWKIKKGKEIIKTTQYNLLSPLVTDTLQLPSFIDAQRFALDNGEYTIELAVIDNAFPEQKSTHTEKITIDFARTKKVYTSDVQALESFKKSNEKSILTKSGYDLIPYNINYYPKAQNTLKFYIEAYNIDTTLGNQAKFVYSYYIENSETNTKQIGLSAFQKQNAAKVNPLLAQFDISQLPTGNYNLVIEIRDSTSQLQAQKKWFFQRQSDAKATLETEVKNISSVEEFFNLYQDADSLKSFVECLWPISGTVERERQLTQISKKDAGLMRSYLVNYWHDRSGDTLDPYKIWISYYKEVLETLTLLKCGKQKGYYTDRGRVYLQYGKPDQRSQYNSEPNTYPYEIWQYNRIYDRATNRFYSNKKFVFANFEIADNCYKLIHSEVKGELYDERWRFRLVNRSQQSSNIDDTKPTGTFGNNIDDNFNNPR